MRPNRKSDTGRARSIARWSVLAPVALAALLLVPQAALAQVCVGNPAMTGQFTLGGGVSLADGATGYGVDARANLDGPISLGAGLGLVDLDDVSNNVRVGSVGLAYDLPVDGFGACPTLGLGYSSWSETFEGVTFELSEFSVPLGLSVGGRLGEGGSALLLPSAGAGVLYYRLRGTLSGGGESLTETETKTEFFVNGGATLVLGQLFLRAGVAKVTVEDSDATVTLGVGVVF